MITLPPPFVAIKYPGYFWNTDDQKLYSLKLAGVLRPMTLYHFSWGSRNGNKKGKFPFVHYRVSHKGKSRSIPLCELEALQTGVPGEIPMEPHQPRRRRRKLP